MGVSARTFFEDDPIVVASAREFGVDETAVVLRRELPDFEYAAIVVFFSPTLEAESFAAALARAFGAAPVYGCTTAGELGPEGVTEGGAVAIGFRSCDFAVVAKPIEDIDASTLESVRRDLAGARAELRAVKGGRGACNRFAIVEHFQIALGRAGDDEAAGSARPHTGALFLYSHLIEPSAGSIAFNEPMWSSKTLWMVKPPPG